jgi:phosphoesterase RecJ-like protein
MDVSLKETARLLTKAERIVITGHVNPDGDCLGSMLALHALLAAKKKAAVLLLADDIPNLYSFLPGCDLISRPGGEKLAADLLVVVDASDAERIAEVRAVVDAKVLNIDHHISNTHFADYLCLNTRAAATGEIILELVYLMKATVTADMATNLYTAIATDCGFFRYANTTATTLRHAADLVDRGASPHIISENLETKPLASIMTLQRVLDSLEVYADGKIAAITVTANGPDEPDTTEGLINYPRNIEGVEIAIMFKPVDDTATRVSFRSRQADVSRLALAFGGGGHQRAAGCTVNSGLAAAKEAVLKSAVELLAEARQ